MPYGEKSPELIQEFSTKITQYLIEEKKCKNMVCENLDELLDLINFYLINDSERLAIAKKGNEYVEKYFTWEYRISNQLKKIIYDLDNKN
jgi:spore maturation protein CgeB